MTLRAVIWCAVSSKAQAGEDDISLPQQEREAREYAAAHGYKVIDVLRVPGFSRRESDVITALEEFAAQEIDAYHKLRKYWQEKAFDILIGYSHGRFGRSTTLHSWVVENTVLSGANIYLLQDGLITRKGLRFQTAMGGVLATSDVDRLVEQRNEKMNQNASRGLPTSSGVVWSHKRVRDDKGKTIKIVVDESKRPIINAVGTLIAEGVDWRNLGHQLVARYSYGEPSDDPHYWHKFYRLLTNPSFWGNSARHYRQQSNKWASIGLWVMEEGHPIPPGVTIFYNTHQAVWPVGDELGDRVRAELRRRKSVVKKARSSTRKFTGLLICGECEYNLCVTNVRDPQPAAYRCGSKGNELTKVRKPCSQRGVISERTIQKWLDQRLAEAINRQNLDALFSDSDQDTAAQQIDDLRTQITNAEQRLRRAIQRQIDLDEGDPAQKIYEEEIRNLNQHLKALQTNLLTLENKLLTSSTQRRDQAEAFAKLQAVGLDGFWQWNWVEINQLLHRIMGQRRLMVLDCQIAGTADAPNRLRNYLNK